MGLLGTFFSFRAAHHAKAASRKLDPQPTPERAAVARAEQGAFPVLWVLFGCLAVASLLVAGAVAFWWLLPIGAVLGFAQFGASAMEADMTPADHRRRSITAITRARCRFDPLTGCTWCGSAAHHVDERGRRQDPLQYHADEVDAAIDAELASG